MAIMPKSEDKYVEKCSTAQSFIRTEMSTYRIGTLGLVTLYHLINIFSGSQSRPNHTSHREVDFNEVFQNSLCCDVGMIIFDLHGDC